MPVRHRQWTSRHKFRSIPAVVCLAMGIAVVTVRSQDQRPTFRAKSDLVSVPVWVEDGNVPVTNLEAGDFEIFDNGVAQQVALLADGSVPIDLMVMIDLAGWGFLPVERVEADLEALGEVLAPGDRVRVLTTSQPFLREVLPWTEAGREPDIVELVPGGLGSRINDGIVAALMTPRVAGRRQVVAALIAGPENRASVDSSRVRDLGGHAQVALFTFQVELTRTRQPLSGADGFIRQQGLFTPSNRLSRLMPVYAGMPPWVFERISALEEAASRTGGRPRDFDKSVLDSLRDLVEDFRRSYVLYFQPSVAAGAGEHELSVRVRGRPELTVRHRSRYSSAMAPADPLPASIERPAEPQPPSRVAPPLGDWCAPEPGPPLGDTELTALLDRYSVGDHDAVVDRLRTAGDPGAAIDRLREAAQSWIEAGLDAAERRMVAAALALEVASPGYPQPCMWPWPTGSVLWSEHRRPLLYWASEQVSRSVRVQPGEREWYLAAIAMLQGNIEFRGDRNALWPDAERLLLAAMARFPDEPRFYLARAFSLEQRYEFGTRLMQRSEVAGAFEKVLMLGDNDVAGEIQLRVVERYLDAESTFSEAIGPITKPDRQAGAPEMLARARAAERAASDPFVIFMGRFFSGRIYDRLDRRAAAELMYRRALEVYPRAQSASLALATLLYLRGERGEAERLVADVLASPGAPDPWRLYMLQDYRRLPLYIDGMRDALRATAGG